MSESIYDITINKLNGTPLPLSELRGKVLLIVNTASECGFTPQYAGLQRLHENYADRGLTIIGCPCNQFGHQEPGDAVDIGSFCEMNYGVTFILTEKIDVNGADAHPLFKYLTTHAPGILGTEAIKWNFTKFLLDREGRIVHRYAPTTVPEKLTGDIEKLLG